MKKWTYIFIFVISMFVIYAIPTFGEQFMRSDETDPVDDIYTFTPGVALNADIHTSYLQMGCEGSWIFNERLGIKGAFIFMNDQRGYMGATLFGKLGPFYGEIGPAFDNFNGGQIFHTGLNGFFPLIGHSGPNFENNLNICSTPDFASNRGNLKGGWIWLISNHSRVFIGGQWRYELNPGGLDVQDTAGLAELVLDERIGPLVIDGKAQIILKNDYSNIEAHISAAYMLFHWIGIGAEYSSPSNSIGVDLTVRI